MFIEEMRTKIVITVCGVAYGRQSRTRPRNAPRMLTSCRLYVQWCYIIPPHANIITELNIVIQTLPSAAAVTGGRHLQSESR